MAFLIILMTFGLISCAGLPDFELSINSADLEQPEREVAETQNVWQYSSFSLNGLQKSR